MEDNKWQTVHIEAVYPVAEDLVLLDPWSSLPAPFVLRDPAHPEAFVTVLFGRGDAGDRTIRFLLGPRGLRSWLQELEADQADDPNGAEPFISQYDGYYMEMSVDTANLNNFERRIVRGKQHIITFRRQRPGYTLATMIDKTDLEFLRDRLTALRQLIVHKRLPQARPQARIRAEYGLSLPCFDLGPEVREAAPFVWKRSDVLKAGPLLMDEFSDARVRHLPASGDSLELFFFYLPVRGVVTSMLSMAFFLVNLDTGLLEWSEMITPKKNWEQDFLRRLWDFLYSRGSRPESIMTFQINLYCTLAADLRRAGIGLDYTVHGFAADEILESYLRITRPRARDLFNDDTPREPY